MEVEIVDKAGKNLGVLLFQGEEKEACKAHGADEFKAALDKCQFVALGKEKTAFAGLGEKKEFEEETAKKAVAKLASLFTSYKQSEFTIDATRVENITALVEGVCLSQYAFLKYKPMEKREKTEIKKLYIITKQGKREAQQKAEKALLVSNAVNYCREMNNEPANVATPSFLASEAKKLGGKNVCVTILDKKKLEELGCGALLSVAAGSVQQPVMVVLDYKPPGFSKTIAIVGKGITFDSGGISIKPAKEMDQMKFDKSGACAVMASVKAISELSLPIRVIGVFAATENLPSGSASKPGDIVTAYNKKTIEILNTDAEGRLILADALSYTIDKYKPGYVIDLATLTGACVVALGSPASGLMSNNDELAKLVINAGEESGDRCWRLPLWREYEERVKSDVADVKNLSDPDREAGAITGAAFLKQFIGETPWAHLDIAATAWATTPRGYYSKGATGAGVRLCVALCKKLCAKLG